MGNTLMLRSMQLFCDDLGLLKRCISKTTSDYRSLDPGWYLYRKVMEYKGDKFSEEFIELVYVTLSAWNMNTRGAKLSNFKAFLKSIIDNKRTFSLLAKEKLSSLAKNEEIIENLRKLFYSLKLVDTKTILVTFSKTLHFLLPDLVVPIDRSYTLKYFRGNTDIPQKKELQFKRFVEIEKDFSEFSNRAKLTRFLDKKWSPNIPKVCDNAVIGCCKFKHL